jgi:regulator of cell morphogenesis and NO signaling
MKITKNSKVGHIVAQNYAAAKVFQVSNIDYCCKGGRSLGEVCQQENIDYQEIMAELQIALSESDRSGKGDDFKNMPINDLANHIEKRHHRYVEEQIPIIASHLVKVCSVHGERHPELYEIQDHFNQAAVELIQHMQKEELVLFPYIKKMVSAVKNDSELEKPLFESVLSPIKTMREEHDNEGERFRKIAALSDNYQPPKGACTTYRVTYKLLEEFEQDLHLHIHLENNLLFPKAIKMENSLSE